jgi:hypothetical protein
VFSALVENDEPVPLAVGDPHPPHRIQSDVHNASESLGFVSVDRADPGFLDDSPLLPRAPRAPV